MGPNPLRRSTRGKEVVEITGLPNIKSTKEKTANNSKQSSQDVIEDKKTETQDADVGGRKRKRFDAIHYKALFKAQRIRTESDVDKELKNQNSLKVQGAPDKDCIAFLEGRVIDSDQIEHGDCPQTKSLNSKSIENGDVEKRDGGDITPSNENIPNSDNHMSHKSSNRIERDLENQQEQDTSQKVTEICKAAGCMHNAENNDVSSNMQSSKFIEFWVPVQLSNVQLEQYCATLLSNDVALRSSSKSDTLGALKDTFITVQKCCNHPYTVDPKIQQSLMKDKDPSMIVDVGVKASGKLQFLDHILPEIQKHKLKVLILFQRSSGSLSLGHILVDFVHRRFGHNSYIHVDGVPNISSKKQAAINMFNKDITKFIFLLESRACHQSINLSSVDAIIIFDSDLNPLNDLKSLQKLSIGSQLKQSMIFRLYSSFTVEEKILKLVENNMAFDIRSQKLRSSYDVLLTWGVSDLFKKLTEFHSQTVLNISSEESFLKAVVEEFLYIISHKCKSSNTTLKSMITRVQNFEMYGKNILLHVEAITHLPNGGQPCVFWRKLLENRFPVWKFISESASRQRKRPNYFLDSPHQRESGVKTRKKAVSISTIEPAKLKTVTEGENGDGVKTRKKAVNISTVEPAKLKTVIEGENGVASANDESQSSSGDRFWSTEVNKEMSLLDFLKPNVSELCNILKFSEDVKNVVESFLEFVINNYKVSKKHTSTLQAFMISVCWIGSSIAKNKIDRSESFVLAKKHLDFDCEEEHAEAVYKKLKQIKKAFVESTQVNDIESSGSHTSEKETGEVPAQQLDDDMEVDVASHAVEDPVAKLKMLEGEFAKKLEEHEKLWESCLKDLKVKMMAGVRQVAAENEFSFRGSQHEIHVVHSGNPEADPTLAGTPIEVQSHDTPHVESVELATPALSEESAEDHNDSCGSDSGNLVCAATSHDKTPSVRPDDEPDSTSSTNSTVAENPSDTCPPRSPLLEPNFKESLEAEVEWLDTVSPQVQDQTHPLEAEEKWLYTVKDNETKLHQEMKQMLNTECEKEIEEIVAQIRVKYEAKHLEADAAYNSKTMELETDINKVMMTSILAEAMRCKCQNLTPGQPSILTRKS